MTALILPIAFVYCDLAPLFPEAGGELIYNTVGLNKHCGFLSAWLIMAAWIAVPPAAIMAIVQWIFHVTNINSSFTVLEIVSAVLLVGYFILSLQTWKWPARFSWSCWRWLSRAALPPPSPL